MRKPPADCRNAQLKMSARLTRIPQQERRGVLDFGGGILWVKQLRSEYRILKK